MTREALSVVVQDVAQRPGTPGDDSIAAWVNAAVADALSGEITVRVVTEAESADLNDRYRGRSGATNVLAFAMAADRPEILDEEPLPLGDLVICADVVEREAAEQRKPPQAHWAHVVVHGTLHLLGYDHAAEADACVMEAHERELLASLGFADPYAEID